MTETDNTKRPLSMPTKFLPYLEKYRIYKLFKDMISDLIINLPKDHLKHMKVYLSHIQQYSNDADRIIVLKDPKLKIDTEALVKLLMKDLRCFVITRRCVMDQYETHDDYVPGCVSPVLMSAVTKAMTLKEPVAHIGWLMFDHPCTVREARCLQQDGVLPTVTLVLTTTPVPAPPTCNNYTPARNFFQQDFEGLKYAYKATLKDVYVNAEDSLEKIANKCFKAVRACAAGAQGPKQGFHVVGAPGVYRVLLLGPRGSGRKTQAYTLAKHFGLVNLYFADLFREAAEKDNELGERIRKFGTGFQVRGEIIKKRLLEKDCIDHGWVLVGYPRCGDEFELLDNHPTPPNRIIFLNIDMPTCKARVMSHGVDWCTGKPAAMGGPRVKRQPYNDEVALDNELDFYFSEALAELRAAAGISADDVDATQSFGKCSRHIKSV